MRPHFCRTTPIMSISPLDSGSKTFTKRDAHALDALGILWNIEALNQWYLSPCRPAASASLLDEFDYRYNSRKETDSMRTIHALKSTTGKRLMLRDSQRPN